MKKKWSLMKMNFNINIDKNKNVLTITIVLSARHRITTSKKKVGYRKMKKLLDENLKLPKGYKLGKCVNPLATVDNSVDTPLTTTWSFELVPPLVPAKPTRTAKRKTTKKTSTKSTRRKSTKKKATTTLASSEAKIENPPEEK